MSTFSQLEDYDDLAEADSFLDLPMAKLRAYAKPTYLAYEAPVKLRSAVIKQVKRTKEQGKEFIRTFNEISFRKIHVSYFLCFSLVGTYSSAIYDYGADITISGGLVLYGLESASNLSFVDALFTAVSAICVTGLTSTDFSKFSLASQVGIVMLVVMTIDIFRCQMVLIIVTVCMR